MTIDDLKQADLELQKFEMKVNPSKPVIVWVNQKIYKQWEEQGYIENKNWLSKLVGIDGIDATVIMKKYIKKVWVTNVPEVAKWIWESPEIDPQNEMETLSMGHIYRFYL